MQFVDFICVWSKKYNITITKCYYLVLLHHFKIKPNSNLK